MVRAQQAHAERIASGPKRAPARKLVAVSYGDADRGSVQAIEIGDVRKPHERADTRKPRIDPRIHRPVPGATHGADRTPRGAPRRARRPTPWRETQP
jgi:hypothetical protein